ncbi:MAG: flagellar biosynthetic protein FliR [Planctomycetes bacterium]|nr:flagellar biosynthetic protein FliR [Planctomycetota bacterium]
MLADLSASLQPAATLAPRAWLFVLIFERLAVVALCSPLLGGRAAPWAVRLAIAAVLCVPLALSLPVPASTARWFFLLLKELALGAVLAAIIQLTFAVFAAAGSLIDTAAGRASRGTFDPISSAPHPTRTLAHLFALAAVFALGGGRLAIEALCTSFTAFPPDALQPPQLMQGLALTAGLRLAAAFFSSAFILAAPVIILILLADIALGALSRLAPSINAFFMGLTIKPLLAILLTAAVLFAAIQSRLPTIGRELSRASAQTGGRAP